MAVQFKPKPGKPHIRMTRITSEEFRISPSSGVPKREWYECWKYCNRVNPACYHTPGDAARALHYGSANK